MITSDVGDQEFQIRIGAKVVTSDGHALGKVCALLPDRFTVEKGMISKRQPTIARGAINTYDPARSISRLSSTRWPPMKGAFAGKAQCGDRWIMASRVTGLRRSNGTQIGTVLACLADGSRPLQPRPTGVSEHEEH